MKDFNIVEVDDEVREKLLTDFPEDGKLLSIRPPSSVSLNDMERLFNTFHTVKTRSEFLKGTVNDSDTCGLEIWYDKGQFEFVFYVPNKEQERHYRKQFVGHFDEIGIEEKVETSFLPMEDGDYVTGGRFHLNHHYFEPVNHTDFTHTDAYQPILSEMDSRDDTKAILQVLYKPAMSSWTKTPFGSVSDYADNIQNGYRKTRKLGIFASKEEYPESYKNVAPAIRSQEDDLAFHVNIRLFFVSPSDSEKLEQQARNVEHQIAREYKRQNGQTFDIQPVSDKDELIELVDIMSNRKEHTMTRASGYKIYFKTLMKKVPILGRFIRDIYKTRMIMTIPELAAVCHLTDSDLLDTIVGADDVYQGGNVPEEISSHDPMTEEEKVKAKKGDSE